MTKLFDAKPFIIAEIGSNWADLRHCLDSIAMAAKAGADAVKFQAFSWPALYGVDQVHVDPGQIPEGYAIPRWIKMPHELPLDWLPKLKEKADACGIELMCTAFSPELVEAVDPYVSVHKVASSDLSYPQLLEAVAKTGKPVLLSTGASNKGDIGEALAHLPDNVVLLYCVASYPALHVDLRVMRELNYEFGGHDRGFHVGFSDHTPGTTVAIEACRQGAVVLEKHVTFFPELETPDRPHSLTGDEFKTMVDYIRGKRQPVIGPTPEEKAMVLRHNRRLIATRDIAVGDVLEYGKNFGAYRSLEDDMRGLSPFAWGALQGRQAKVAIARGKGIGPGDFG